MEKCITTCTIFYVILITHMFVYGYTLINSSDLKKLDSLLSEEQRIIYSKIKKERLHHFYIGLGIGSLLGLFIILYNSGFKSKFCLSGIILILTTVIVYYVLPKSDYMIQHLTTEEQKISWLRVSRNFHKKKMVGFILAMVLYFCIPLLF
jgi:hypothetical protein